MELWEYIKTLIEVMISLLIFITCVFVIPILFIKGLALILGL